MRVRIAVVQFRIRPLAPGVNLKRAESFVRKAASAGADLVVFPEDFVYGPIEGEPGLADFGGHFRDHFRQLARQYNIDIVPGSTTEGGRSGIYNTTYYVSASGRIKARYRKINLWDEERVYLTPGHRVSVFDTRFGRVGLIICWDLISPEIFRAMAGRGAGIVICPSYWRYEDAGKGLAYDPESETKLVDSVCVARAFEYEMIMVYCNAAGRLQVRGATDTLIGHSQVAVPFLGCIKRAAHNHEQMFIQEVDTAILRRAESVYRARADLRRRIVY